MSSNSRSQISAMLSGNRVGFRKQGKVPSAMVMDDYSSQEMSDEIAHIEGDFMKNGSFDGEKILQI